MSTFNANNLIANIEKGFRKVIEGCAAKKDVANITKITIHHDTERAGDFKAVVSYALSTEFELVEGFEPTKVNVGASIVLHNCHYVAATGEIKYETDRMGFYVQGAGEWYAKSATQDGGAVWSLCDIDNDVVRVFYDHEMLFDEDMVEIALVNAFKNSAKVIYPLQHAISERVLAHYQASLTPAMIEYILMEQQRIANKPVHKSAQIAKSIRDGFAKVLASFIESNNENTVVQKRWFESGGDGLIIGSLDCKFTTEFEPVEGFEPTKVDVHCSLCDIKYYLNADTGEWEWLDGDFGIGITLPSTGIADWYRKDGDEWLTISTNPTCTTMPCNIPLDSYEHDVAIAGLQSAFTKLQAIKYQIVSSIADKALAKHLDSKKNEVVDVV